MHKFWCTVLVGLGLALCLAGCQNMFPRPVYMPPVAPAPQALPPPPVFRPTLYVSVNRLNLRACPGMDCPKIAVLDQNQEVEKVGDAADWSQIRITRDGTIGWVNSRYLSPTPVAATPEVAPAPTPPETVTPPPLPETVTPPPLPQIPAPAKPTPSAPPAVEKPPKTARPGEAPAPAIKKPEEVQPPKPAKPAKPARPAKPVEEEALEPEQPAKPERRVKPVKPGKPAPPEEKPAPPTAPEPEKPSKIRIM